MNFDNTLFDDNRYDDNFKDDYKGFSDASYIMAIWKEFNPDAEKSMKDDFQSTPSPFCKRIVEYLNNGEVVLASPSCATDVISGKKINQTSCILTDGEYTWLNTLGYYVQEYNLQIPKELEGRIMQIKGSINNGK